MTDELLYLGAADIEALGLGVSEVFDAVDAILRQKSLGRTFLEPKLTVSTGAGATVSAMVGAAQEPAASVLKWLGVNAGNPARGLPQINALVVLNDTETGRVQTVMNGNWITGVRTAACSAIAAHGLARPDAATVGFAGCGLQARTHLAALRHVLPGLRHACLLGRTEAPVRALAEEVEAAGMTVQIAHSPREVVAGMDVVVSSVPPSPGMRPFLDPGWLSPDAYVTAVDLGRSWIAEQWRQRFDVIVTDDHEQSGLLGRSGKMSYAGPFDAEIGDLATGACAGRTGPEQRTCLIFGGIALADLGLAALIDRVARQRSIGRLLPA